MSVLLERPRRTKSAPVGVVGKVIQILERLDQAPGGLLLREIVNSTTINKSTAYRFLSHLESEGYVFRDSDGYYMVGPKLAKLGSGATYQATLCRTSAGILERLRAATGETVNLAVLDGSETLYLSVFAAPERVVGLGWMDRISFQPVASAVLRLCSNYFKRNKETIDERFEASILKGLRNGCNRTGDRGCTARVGPGGR